jgi:hypothetical protein
MRIISEFETQFKLGQVSLNKIKLDYKSRDDITKLLLGIQHIWLKLQKRGKSELELQISVNFFSVIENILQ